MSAPAGQPWAQAGWSAPSTISRSSALASVLADLDALHAERALLHHPDLAQRDVGIQLQLQRLLPLRVEEVEEPHVVHAGVAAVAGADAAVVDLRVQPVLVVVAGVGRAHRLARGVVALLAQHRPERQLRVRELALPVAFDADPVHRPAARRFLRADGRDVVLGMAGGNAGLAARALVEIDDHAPALCHRQPRPWSSGRSRVAPAKRIRLPSASPTRVTFTRVAAQASVPVSGSSTGASTRIGLAPRPLA